MRAERPSAAESRLRTAHATVDLLVGHGVSPASAFGFVAQVLGEVCWLASGEPYLVVTRPGLRTSDRRADSRGGEGG